MPRLPVSRLLRTTCALGLSAHPGPAAAVTALSALLARSAGLPTGRGARLVTAVGCGQLLIGWSNDLLDASRDHAVGRADKPVAKGEVAPTVVAMAGALAATGSIVASLGCGRAAGLMHLGLVGCGLVYNLGLKSTWVSFVPYAVAFGALPSVAALAAPVPPRTPWTTTAGAALLGVSAHLVNALPDLEDDAATGVAGLPHRLGASRTRAVVGALLLAATAVLLVGRRPLSWVDLAPAGASLVLVPTAVRTRGRSSLAAVVAIACIDIALLASPPTKGPNR